VNTGGGTLNLAAVNTYTGTTTVNAGTLAVAGSIASSPDVIVNAGAAFEAGSTQTVKHLTVAGGVARVAAGGPVKVLTVGDNTLHVRRRGHLRLRDLRRRQDRRCHGRDGGRLRPRSDAAALAAVRTRIARDSTAATGAAAASSRRTPPPHGGKAVGYALASEVLGAAGGTSSARPSTATPSSPATLSPATPPSTGSSTSTTW
jgi:autotransporter-associated beta strand protein